MCVARSSCTSGWRWPRGAPQSVPVHPLYQRDWEDRVRNLVRISHQGVALCGFALECELCARGLGSQFTKFYNEVAGRWEDPTLLETAQRCVSQSSWGCACD